MNVVGVADGEAGVDRGGSGAPVFVELEAHDAGADLGDEAGRRGVVAFAGDSDVEGNGVGGLEHRADVGGGGCTGCGICAGGGTGAAADEGGDAGGE